MPEDKAEAESADSAALDHSQDSIDEAKAAATRAEDLLRHTERAADPGR